MEVVSNSSPIIHLAKIGKVDLLKLLFDTIKIPKAVYQECVIEGGSRPEVKVIKNARWIKVLEVDDTNLIKLLKTQIDEGESEAIVLALEIGADLLLLDDYEAREKARLFGLTLEKKFICRDILILIAVALSRARAKVERDVQSSMFNVQRSTFYVRSSMFKVQGSKFNVQCFSNLEPRT